MKGQYGTNVICPYYKDERQHLIRCEGPEDDSTFHVAFPNPRRTREYRQRFCEGCWRKCIIAEGLNKKYEYEP